MFAYLQCDQIGLSWMMKGDLLQFGQLFKACGNIYFVQIARNFWAIFVKV